MSKRAKPRLGRGLSSLIREPVQVETSGPPGGEASPESGSRQGVDEGAGGNHPSDGGGLIWAAVDELVPNRYQPRRDFDIESLDRLASSIRMSGMMQPIVVRRLSDAGEPHPEAVAGSRWEIVAGERRWRAAKLAGLERVPAVVNELDDRHAAEWAVVENLQREDLNPMERAWAFRRLIEQFGLSQAELGEHVGVERSTVANFIRLTELENEIQDLISRGVLSTGHGKVLLGLAPGAERARVGRLVANAQWSVRRLERWVKSGGSSEGGRSGGRSRGGAPARPELAALEKQLGEHLGTRVQVKTASGGKKGQITIEFYDLDHFDALMGMLGFELRS